MEIHFNASIVTVDETADHVMVAFADREDSPFQYLILQRALAPSDQDRRLGHDLVYLEVNDQLHSCYGGIDRLRITDREIVIDLSEDVVNSLGGVSRVAISGPQEELARDDLLQALQGMVEPDQMARA